MALLADWVGAGDRASSPRYVMAEWSDITLDRMIEVNTEEALIDMLQNTSVPCWTTNVGVYALPKSDKKDGGNGFIEHVWHRDQNKWADLPCLPIPQADVDSGLWFIKENGNEMTAELHGPRQFCQKIWPMFDKGELQYEDFTQTLTRITSFRSNAYAHSARRVAHKP